MEARDAVKDEVFFVPLGGGMWFGETAEETLRREVLEEIGAEIAECRLLTALENHFEQEGQQGHEIVFVFAAVLRDSDLESRESMTVIDGNNEHFQGSWRTLASFRSALSPTQPPLFPEALTDWLRLNPGVVQ
jgi:ADP-ribose pyrophosphatase YjhB (NUDIX family)